MSMFTKRREEDEAVLRPGETPPPVTTPPSQFQPAAAASSASRTMPVAAPRGTNIGRTVTIKGDIRSEEDLVIDGQMEGRLDLARNRLVVGTNGSVRAAIAAREVEVQGILDGKIEAAERVVLRKDSKMVGDLKMASVVIEEGADFKGRIDIVRPQDANSVTAGVNSKPS